MVKNFSPLKTTRQGRWLELLGAYLLCSRLMASHTRRQGRNGARDLTLVEEVDHVEVLSYNYINRLFYIIWKTTPQYSTPPLQGSYGRQPDIAFVSLLELPTVMPQDAPNALRIARMPLAGRSAQGALQDIGN